MASRHFEYQADEFAVELGHDLNEPLICIHEENLASLSVPLLRKERVTAAP